MSTIALRHHAFTFAFLPVRRVRRFESAMKSLRLRASRRQIKKAVRAMFL